MRCTEDFWQPSYAISIEIEVMKNMIFLTNHEFHSKFPKLNRMVKIFIEFLNISEGTVNRVNQGSAHSSSDDASLYTGFEEEQKSKG